MNFKIFFIGLLAIISSKALAFQSQANLALTAYATTVCANHTILLFNNGNSEHFYRYFVRYNESDEWAPEGSEPYVGNICAFEMPADVEQIYFYIVDEQTSEFSNEVRIQRCDEPDEGFEANQLFVKLKNGTVKLYNSDNIKQIYFKESVRDRVSISGNIGGYSYVDLGLEDGVKWATFNVGASSPEQYGNFYAWGEILPKNEFLADNYRWYDYSLGFPIINKYVNPNGESVNLEMYDDAASANWGESWRMPTPKEIETLINGCNWSWCADFYDSGIAGYLGVSKTNNNTIFLPAGGWRELQSEVLTNQVGNYWSSEMAAIPEHVSIMSSSLTFDDSTSPKIQGADRVLGFLVRAVVK